MNLAEHPVKLDSRIRFRVHLFPGEVLSLIDQLPSSVAKTANLKLYQEDAAGTLGINAENLKRSWENIQKIEIRVGTERYRPYMNDIFVAKPVRISNFYNFSHMTTILSKNLLR